MESFWCKVLFKQFISHFRKLSDDAIIADIKDSMDALEELQETGDSFGAMMVRLSNKRILENSEKRAEAGRKGGYAKAKNCKKKKAEATPSEQPGVNEPSRSKRKFHAPSTQDLYDFCADNGLDEADARDCFEMSTERGWKDQNGKQIVDWKKFVIGFCESRQNKRSA